MTKTRTMANSASSVPEEGNSTEPKMEGESIWFCPSRWLLALHDAQANISTMSSHLCLADLNDDGENLLALVDFKQGLTNSLTPNQCRLRVYRGKHLVYNHFLDDMPSCMVVTSNRVPVVQSGGKFSNRQQTSKMTDRLLLTLPINDDIYFYHRLKPQHRISLEDDERILNTLNKSELDTWQVVKQNKVDLPSMRELLLSLREAHGSDELTSHTNNFLALNSDDERKNYLLMWKFKKLSNGTGEHIMSMDTICCAAARLRYDHAKSSNHIGLNNSSSRNKLMDIQKDGIVLGTEDRHLLVYELGFSRAHLEANYRLPSTADHILVERRSPFNFDPKSNLHQLTYKILISCRNCRIYSIDQNYLVDKKHNSTSSGYQELVALSSNIIDMCWTAEDDTDTSLSSSSVSQSSPNFVVACLDRKVYCFSSKTGQNKWIAECELPISCLVSMAIPRVSQDETCLVGVASQTNRIDFYISSTGRIVDSIYLSDDFCQAMVFGRFGREDNCLCLITHKGSLLILILKRTAKFANAQCLSSAASYAAHVVTARCLHSAMQDTSAIEQADDLKLNGLAQKQLSQPAQLPKPFAITKSSIVNPEDRALDQLQLNHNCEQFVAKEALDLHLIKPKLQIPAKNRDFVDQIVEQAQHSKLISKTFARDLLKLGDKVRLANEQQSEMMSCEDANRISLIAITGLGNIYRVSLSLHLCLSSTIDLDDGSANNDVHDASSTSIEDTIMAQVLLFAVEGQQKCHLSPFKFDIELRVQSKNDLKSHESNERDSKNRVSEKIFHFNLVILEQDNFDVQQEFITLDVYILPSKAKSFPYASSSHRTISPFLVSSINIPICQ